MAAKYLFYKKNHTHATKQRVWQGKKYSISLMQASHCQKNKTIISVLLFLFLQPLHKVMEPFHRIDVAVADFVVLADVIAAFDEIVLAGALRFCSKHADFAMAVTNCTNAFFSTAGEAAMDAFKSAVPFEHQVHEVRIFNPAQVGQSLKIDTLYFWPFQLFRFRKQLL